jgi:uncharacterized MAPEG superfamily protein
LNQIEAFIGFAVAILLAETTTLSTAQSAEIHQLANAFIFIRVLYNIVYILAFNDAFAMIRSTIFAVGITIVFNILFIAGGNFF